MLPMGSWNLRLRQRWAIGLVLIVATARGAHAGAPMVGCDRPFVFSGAKVNVVVLPYTYSGQSEKPLSAAAHKLSGLIYLNTLFSILKLQSIGVVQLTASDPWERTQCTDEIVVAKLLGAKPGGQAQVSAGHGLIVMWGRLYEEGNDIYVQTYVRFFRRGTVESVNFKAGEQVFTANLSSQAIAFPPRKLNIADLNRIQEEFNLSSGIRDVPNLSAPSHPLPIDTSPYAQPFGYSIAEVKGDWMNVIPFGHAAAPGWVLGRFENQEWSLGHKVPEISFVEALAAYLIYRSTPGASKSAVSDAFAKYDRASQGQDGGIATAVEDQILGIVNVLNAGEGSRVALGSDHAGKGVEETAAQFGTASGLIPENAEARNMDACGNLWVMWSKKDRTTSSYWKATQDLIGALALDPENDRVLGNLQSVYEQMLQFHVGSEAEVAQRLEAVKKLRSAVATARVSGE